MNWPQRESCLGGIEYRCKGSVRVSDAFLQGAGFEPLSVTGSYKFWIRVNFLVPSYNSKTRFNCPQEETTRQESRLFAKTQPKLLLLLR